MFNLRVDSERATTWLFRLVDIPQTSLHIKDRSQIRKTSIRKTGPILPRSDMPVPDVRAALEGSKDKMFTQGMGT